MVYRPPSDTELSTVAALRAALEKRGVAVRAHRRAETGDDALLRYLRARNGHVEKASAAYAATAAWREEGRIEELRGTSGADALGADVAIVRRYLPHSQAGVDREGGPLIFKHMGAQLRVKQACERDGLTLDGLARYNAWLNETYMAALDDAGAREWSVVVDAAGWHLGLFNWWGYQMLKQTATVDAAHYPELLHTMVVVNAPSMLAVAWRVISTWVDDETRRKIQIISERSPDKAREALKQLADASQLPAQYGGSAPPLADWPTRAGVPEIASEMYPEIAHEIAPDIAPEGYVAEAAPETAPPPELS